MIASKVSYIIWPAAVAHTAICDVDNKSIYIDYSYMTRTRAPSAATRATLLLLAEHTHGLHGYDITKQAGVSPGTLYPMLARLEAQGLLTAHWSPAVEAGRPPRHVYRLTAAGVAFTRGLRNTEGVPLRALRLQS